MHYSQGTIDISSFSVICCLFLFIIQDFSIEYSNYSTTESRSYSRGDKIKKHNESKLLRFEILMHGFLFIKRVQYAEADPHILSLYFKITFNHEVAMYE